MIVFSFIIPHKNSPDLLDRCLKSIPSRDDIEIIVVDDDSDTMLKPHISRKDVKVIYLENSEARGAGKARNVGLAHAKGRWLLFADADDFYTDKLLEVLDEYKNAAIDILYFNCESVYSDTLERQERAMPINDLNLKCNGNDKESEYRMRFKVQVPWVKMINADYVKRYGFQFEEINNGNDIQFSYLCNYFTNNYVIDHRVVYICTFNRNSITFKKRNKVFYICSLQNHYKKIGFRKLIQRTEWNDKIHRLYFQSLKKGGVQVFLQLLFYHLSHFVFLKSLENKYVNLIKEIETKIDVQ